MCSYCGRDYDGLVDDMARAIDNASDDEIAKIKEIIESVEKRIADEKRNKLVRGAKRAAENEKTRAKTVEEWAKDNIKVGDIVKSRAGRAGSYRKVIRLTRIGYVAEHLYFRKIRTKGLDAGKFGRPTFETVVSENTFHNITGILIPDGNGLYEHKTILKHIKESA